MSTTRDFTINLAASAAFGVVVLVVTNVGIAWSTAIALGVCLAGSSIWGWRRGGDDPGLAVIGATEVHPGPQENVESMLDGAENAIDFWGLSANRTAKSAAGKAAMRKVGVSGGRIRFLLLNPDSEHLSRRADDEGDSSDSWRDEIRSTVSRLRDTAKREGYSVEIRYYDHYPVWRMVALDRSRMHVNWFLPRKPGHHSPGIDLAVKGDGLAVALCRAFEESWEVAEDA